eukprot:scaffold2764_cov22-Cyclotella_meneghiniana.AAC.1
MKQLQTAFAALGMFGLVLIVGFVYTARNSRKLTSKKLCKRVNHGVNEGVDDNAMVSTESMIGSKSSRKQTKDEIVIVESSSSLHRSMVNQSTGSSIAPSSRDDFNGCGGRNESCHETLHLISCQHENNKGAVEEEESSIRQWYDDLLSPRPTAAAADAAVTASGDTDTGMPLRTLFSNASPAKNGDNDVKNVVMTMPRGQVLSKGRDSSQVDMLVPVKSSTQQLTANCQGGECSTISTVVLDTEKDYDRVEKDKASEGQQLHNNSRDPQDRLSVNADFPAADFEQQIMSITKNQHGNIAVNRQEGESTAAAILLQGQTLLQDKSSQTNDCNIRIDCEELTPVTKNKHDSIVTSKHYRQEASSIVKSPFSPVSKTANINFLELAERIEASENDVIIANEETMSTPLLPRRSACDVRVVSPDNENEIKSAVVADDDEPIDNTDVAVVDHCHDIICETDSKIPASVVIHPEENM